MPGHQLTGKTGSTLRELIRHPFAIPDWAFGIRQVMEAACHVQQLAINISLEANSIEALRSYARTGAGVTVLPSLVVKLDLRRGDCVAVPIREALFEQSSMDIVVREGRKLTHLIREFLDNLTGRFQPDRAPADYAPFHEARG